MQATSAGHREPTTWLVRLCFVSFLVKAHRKQTGDTLLLHGRTEDSVGRGDGTLIMGDHQELGETGELADDIREAVHVGVVEGSVELVEHAERRGLHHIDGEEQCDGGHGPLAAGEQRDAAQLGARGLGDNFDAALKRVFGLNHGKVGRATHEEALEGELEVFTHLFEGVSEELEGRSG